MCEKVLATYPQSSGQFWASSGGVKTGSARVPGGVRGVHMSPPALRRRGSLLPSPTSASAPTAAWPRKSRPSASSARSSSRSCTTRWGSPSHLGVLASTEKCAA